MSRDRTPLEIEYQPIVNLATGQLSGFEALLRWPHPTYGLISPGEFIPLAEDTGLILPLGEWVLKTACHQIQHWQQVFPQRHLNLAVNISGRQLLKPNFVYSVDQVLQDIGFKPSHLTLEVTESTALENFQETAVILNQLRALGLEIAIDDFGTGHSCLSRLHSFSAKSLKIDRDFVRQMGDTGKRSEVVKAIIAVAHSLNMQVVAEGIETVGQLNRLRALNCDQGQGYYFSRSLPCSEVTEMLTKAPDWPNWIERADSLAPRLN